MSQTPIHSWRNCSPGDLSIELAEVTSTPVEPAVRAAADAFRVWSRLPMEERSSFLKRAQAAIAARKDELARGIALETGKPIREALGEVGAVVAKFDLTIADAERYLRDEPAPGNPNPARVRRLPRGPAAVIGPFNFPLHLAHGGLVAHLIAGNTVIFKPSPLAAVVAGQYAELMTQVFPPGVFNLVQGGGAEGQALAVHPAVRSVVFTGSATVGRQLAAATAGDLGKDVALELGGKNAVIVCRDADLQKAADAAAEGACLTAGQRCNATSRVIVEAPAVREFIELFVKSIGKFVPADPMRETTLLGPMISAAAVARYDATSRAVRRGEWLVEPKVVGEVNGKRGHYVAPAVVSFESTAADASGLHVEEAFAPIVAVYEAADVADAVRIHNLAPYGLTASIFTGSRDTFDAIGAELTVGNLYANLPTTGSPSTLPFGGLRDSGNRHPGGRGFVRFTADEQAVQEAAGSLK
jgi:succinylglutamic semialdehyde dehydrogenase